MDAPRDIPELLAGMARLPAADLARPAVSFYRGRTLAGRLTYAALGDRARSLAADLRDRLGVAPGDRVAVLAPNRLEVPPLYLAIMSLGAAVVPLNPTAPHDVSAFALAHSGASGLVGARELLGRFDPPGPAGFVRSIEALGAVEGGAREAQAGPGEAAARLGSAMAVVLYTSGTTGSPKGVALSQGSVLANAWSLARRLGLDRTTQLAVLPLYHAHAFGFGLMTALVTRGHLVFTDGLDPFAWAALVRAEAVTVASVVPSLLAPLLEARVRRERVPTLESLLVSSAPLPAALARRFEEETAIPLVHGWGLSEYTNFACCLSPRDPERRRLLLDQETPSVGSAIPGAEVRVTGERGAELGEGVRGELRVRGPSAMLSYLGDEEATRRTLEDGWVRTGDEGLYRVDRGERVFFVTGRLKDLIVRGAEKHSPVAIERRLAAAVPELEGRLAVVGFAHRVHGEEVGAYVELDPLPAATRAGLLLALEAMPVETRPKVVLHGPWPIPRTHTGKVQRRLLQGRFAPFAELVGPARILRSEGGWPAPQEPSSTIR